MAHAIAEVDEQMEPYRQRSVYAVHPELSFYQLNEDVPPKHSKASAAGIRERRELLLRRLNGMERVLDSDIPGATQSNVLDAAVSLWTARRIIAKAATRLPIDPEWDDNGLRMEWVR
jgi:predicted RNase H-like nuclease